MDQELCPVGHQSQQEANPIYHHLPPPFVVLSIEKCLSFSMFSNYSVAKQFAFKKFMRGEFKAFSKFKIKVSTSLWFFKMFAQSSITVVTVSQLCHFLNECCLSDKSLCSSRWDMMLEHTCSKN